MERRQVAIHAVDQARVDVVGMFGGVERSLERARVIARLGVEDVFCTWPFSVDAEGAAEAAKRAEERGHHFFAIATVRHGAAG